MKTAIEYMLLTGGALVAALLLAAIYALLVSLKHERDRRDEEGL